MKWLKSIIGFLLLIAISGCVAPWLQEPLRENKELNTVLDAYKTQNAELSARREAAASQGIRVLSITRDGASGSLLITVDLERAALPTVVGRILNEAGISYVVEPGLMHGTVTSRLTNVPLIRAVNALLAPSGLIATMRDSVLAIKESDVDDSAPGQASTSKGVNGKATGSEAAASKKKTEEQKPAAGESAKKGGKAAAATKGATSTDKPSSAAKSEEEHSVTPPPGSIVSKEVPLTHIDAPTATAFLDGLAKRAPSDTDPGLRFSPQPYTNTVFLSGSKDSVAQAAKALRDADRDPAHVIIEVLVVALENVGEEDLGVDLKYLTTKSGNQFMTAFGSLTQNAFTYLEGVKNPSGLRAEIDVLVSRNKARIIARPYLATASGRKAKIEIVKDQYLITQQVSGSATISAPQAVSTGVKLEILPQVARDGKVRMDVSVEQSQFIPQLNPDVATEIARNFAQTTMEVESGQSILIGGMSQHLNNTSSAGLPWLRNIPILNIFFAKFEADSRRQEVLVYLTPYIVWSPDLNVPIPEPDAFGPKEPRDLLSPMEGGVE